MPKKRIKPSTRGVKEPILQIQVNHFNNEKLPTFEVNIQGEKMVALLDNCSSLNLIDLAVIKKINRTWEINEKINQLTSMGGLVHTLGNINLKVWLANRCFLVKFGVIEKWELDTPLILGLPFIKNNGVDYLGKNNILRIQGTNVQRTDPKKFQKIIATLMSTETLKPNEYKLVHAEIDKTVEGIVVIIGVETPEIKVESGISETTDKKICMVLSNIGKNEIQIPAGTKLAKVLTTKICHKNEKTKLDWSHTNLQHLSKENSDKIKSLVEKNSDCFAKNPTEITGMKKVEPFKIIVNDASKVKAKPYLVPEALKNELENQISELLKGAIIRPSRSPYSSPVVLVKKKDKTVRMCIDYRALNKVTLEDRYPLPLINSVLEELGGNKIFSSLDCYSGYFQMLIHPESIPYTAFITQNGLYEFLRLPFGLVNAPAEFQRTMNKILQGLPFVRCYLDDILIASKSVNEHLIHLEAVFIRLREYNVKLKLSKCQFGQFETKYLGHIITGEGVKIDTEKFKAIENFPAPTTVLELQSFIGLATYYARFIPHFADSLEPLFRLLKKDVEYKWEKEQQDAFQQMKTNLITEQILVYPDFIEEFFLFTDASILGLGGVLCQKDKETGCMRPISYYSRALKGAEARYSATELELLALVYCCKKAKPYLFGRKFTIFCDHQALIYLIKTKDMTSRLAKFALKLLEYRFVVIHLPGKVNKIADALSRIDWSKVENEVFQDKLAICSLQIKKAQDLVDEKEVEISQKINNSTKIIFKSIVDGKGQGYQIQDKLIYRITENGTRRIIVPIEDRELIKKIIFSYHDTMLGGHLGLEKTKFNIQSRFIWAGMTGDIGRHVKNCKTCQKIKFKPHTKRSLERYPIPNYPFEYCSIDLKGPLPITESGNRYILVFIDWYSRYAEAIALANKEASTVARALVNGCFCRHGFPKFMLTDRGKEFENDLLDEICKLLGIKKLRTTPYHPESNGLIERFNRTLGQLLMAFTQSRAGDWDQYLQLLMFTYRSTIHSATRETPFYALYFRDIAGPNNINVLRPYSEEDDFANEVSKVLKSTRELIRLNLGKSKDKQEKLRDTIKKDEIFAVGDLIMFYDKGKVTNKLKLGAQGPFRITSFQGRNVVNICRESNPLDVKTVHLEHCKKYNEEAETSTEIGLSMQAQPTQENIDIVTSGNERVNLQDQVAKLPEPVVNKQVRAPYTKRVKGLPPTRISERIAKNADENLAKKTQQGFFDGYMDYVLGRGAHKTVPNTDPSEYSPPNLLEGNINIESGPENETENNSDSEQVTSESEHSLEINSNSNLDIYESPINTFTEYRETPREDTSPDSPLFSD